MFDSWAYWRAVLERLTKTFAQAMAAYLIASGVTSAWDVNWNRALGIAALAAVLSFATSVASTSLGASRGPSLAGETLPDTPAPHTPGNASLRGRHERPDE